LTKTEIGFLTATEIVKRIRAGGLSPVAAVEACLARIAETEPALRAWVHLDTEGALKAARALEAQGCTVGVIVLAIDRGGAEHLRDAGFWVKSVVEVRPAED